MTSDKPALHKRIFSSQIVTGPIDTLWLAMVLCHLFILLAPFFWWFNLFSHMRLLGLVGGVTVLVLLLAFMRGSWSTRFGKLKFGTTLACIGWNAAVLLPYLPGADAAACTVPKQQGQLQVVMANVSKTNGLRFTQDLPGWLPPDTDILMLTELPFGSADLSDQLSDQLPHMVTAQPDTIFGVAIYSRHPITSHRIIHDGGARWPVLTAEIASPTGPMTVMTFHPPPPMSAAFARQHRLMMQTATIEAEKIEGPLLLGGDLNATPFGAHFRQLVQQGQLDDPRRRHGYLASWPVFGGKTLATVLNIDHLLSRDLTADCLQTLPIAGSDHHAMLGRFTARPATQRTD